MDAFAAVLELARRSGYDGEHSEQVTKLALELFDELGTLHGLGERERFLLRCAGMLHDIGWLHGQKKHHKTSLRMIREADNLPLGKQEQRIVGLVARYHRKAMPSPRHEEFRALGEADRDKVRMLAAMLRVADGLDRSHTNVVRALACEVAADEIVVRCTVRGPTYGEVEAATKKGDLFEDVFHRRLLIETTDERQ